MTWCCSILRRSPDTHLDMASVPVRTRKAIGLLTLWISLMVVARELGLVASPGGLLYGPLVLLVLLLTLYVSWSRRVFVLLAAALSLMNLAWNSDWRVTLEAGIFTAGFIAAFFSALTTLKFSAASSPAIRNCGQFLSQQPPGRRYLALTFGGQLFGLLLNYGAIQLLGAMSVSNVGKELDDEIRGHRIRRMLLAIQRGFISILPWSPFSFAIVISTTLVPGASWSQAALPGLVNGAILAGVGWLLDQLFKPRLATPAPARPKAQGSWLSLLPLFFLLCLLAVILGVLHMLSGVRILVLVMIVTPLVSIAWIMVQTSRRKTMKHVKRRVTNYLMVQMTGFRSEMVLLMMAGYLGTVASPLLGTGMRYLGIDLTAMPAWALLVSIVWLIPIAGQLGMNPILFAALMAPLLPEAATLGVTPSAIITAMTAGWILSGVSSPFTATTLIVGSFAGVSSSHVGQRWNGIYTLLCAVILSAWVVVYSLQA
jgi:hypothetical protein